jgi:hypothetical protein
VKSDPIEGELGSTGKIVRVNGVLVFVDSAKLPLSDFAADARNDRISDLIERSQESFNADRFRSRI